MIRNKLAGRDGQSLPLFAIIIPGLLALMALGIDGANVFLAKRDAQGAADLAAVSAAKMLPDKVAAEALAESIGIANGYTAAEVTPNADFGDDSQIEVAVKRQQPTYFMPILSFFGAGDFTVWDVNARAVAQHDAGSSSTGDYALYSLEECGDKEDFSALNWSGENNEVIGSAHSNAGTYISGNNTTVTQQFSVTCDSSNISDKYAYNETGDNPDLSSGEFNPDDCDGSEDPGEVCRQDVPPPPIPFFDHGTKQIDTSAIASICDQTYNSDTDISSNVNGNICALNSKLVIKNGTSTSTGVTFFAKEISIADADIVLTQPNYQGVMLYSVTSEEGKGIDYSGNSGEFEGIWYSPRPSSLIKFQGNTNTLDGALVGYRVDYSGNNNVLTGDFGATAASDPSVALIE